MKKQQEVINYLMTVGEATKKDIYNNVSFGYYHNEMKHLGDLLKRMVDNGKVIRPRKGVYKINRYAKKTEKALMNQETLF